MQVVDFSFSKTHKKRISFQCRTANFMANITSIKKIMLLGHRGMVGKAISRLLAKKDPSIEIVTVNKEELDLRDKDKTLAFILNNHVDAIVVAAAKVGGIKFNDDFPVDFLNDNLGIALNVMSGAAKANIKKLLYLGSSCIYPKSAQQPITEEQLFSGPLESTNEAYALAKIVGVKLCDFYNRQHGTDFRALMPCNLYGPGDSYSHDHSHVIPSLIMKMHDAKESKYQQVGLWGNGNPLREFLYVDDMACACLQILFASKSTWQDIKPHRNSFINVGSGQNVSIAELADLIRKVVGFKGEIKFDVNDLNGVNSKLLDSERIRKFGWKDRVKLDDGLVMTYQDYLSNLDKASG